MGASEDLVGRSAELAVVGALVTRLHDDGAALVLVGSAGVGKTAVVRAGQVMAEEAGVRTHSVTPTEFDTADAFASLRTLLRPLRPYARQLPGTAQGALSVVLGLDPGSAPRIETLAAAVLALLHQATRTAPLLLVVDDAQWLDAASAEVIAFIGRRLEATRIGLLAAMRGGERSPLSLADLPEHLIAPLGESESSTLLQSRFPQLAPAVRRRIVQETEGLPLALLEMPLSLDSAQRVGDAPLPERLPVAQRLHALFSGRLDELTATTQAELLLAALQGAAGELSVLRQAAAFDPELTGLSAAEDAGLVRVHDTPACVEFTHPLVRATVVNRATEAQRRAAHRALAAAYPAGSGPHAWHLADATPGQDEAVAEVMERHALRTMSLGDASGALAALQRAADLSVDRAARARREIRAAFVGADVTGDLARAAELLQHAERLAPALTSSLAATVSASSILLNGQCDVDMAHGLLVSSIEAHAATTDPGDQHLVDALHSVLLMSWFGGRRSLWLPFERAVSRLGDSVPSDLDLCHRMFGDPVHLAAPALERLDSALACIGSELDPIRVTRLSLAGVYTDRLDQCREALWRVITDGRSGGAVALAINALVSSCVDDWLRGSWDEALDLCAEGFQLSDTHGYPRYSVILGGYIEQLVRVARGESDDDLGPARRMAQWATERGAGQCEVFALHLQTLRAIAAEDFESAFGHVTTACPPGTLPPYSPHVLWMLFDLVESAVRTGRPSAARSHVEAMRAHGIQQVSPRLQMLVHGCAGLALDDEVQALGEFAAALAVPAGPRWAFDRARIALSFAERLRDSGRLEEARHQFRQALEVFDQLGAVPWSRRAGRGLRATGGSLPHGPDPRAATLTAREHRVAALAASGLTNRQIAEQLYLSPRTVGAILYRVFPKLGVTSRTALRAALDAQAQPSTDT